MWPSKTLYNVFYVRDAVVDENNFFSQLTKQTKMDKIKTRRFFQRNTKLKSEKTEFLLKILQTGLERSSMYVV